MDTPEANAVPDLWAGLPSPYYSAHRGNMARHVENTLEAFRLSVAEGAHFLEMDVWTTADGVVVVNHDRDVNRTTTAYGDVARFTLDGWRNITMNGNEWGPAWEGSTVHPPVLSDVLREFADRVMLSIDPKGSGAGPLIRVLNRHVTRRSNVLISSATLADVDAAVAAGYRAAYRTNTHPVDDLVARGIDQVNLNDNASPDYVADLHAAGIFVQGYTVRRHIDRDRLLALGCDGLVCDDTVYVTEAARRTRDPWAAQSWYPGHIESDGWAGTYVWPDEWGYRKAREPDNYGGSVQGWGCPVKGDQRADDYRVEVNFRIDKGWSHAAKSGLAVSRDDSWFNGDERRYPGFVGYVGRVNLGGEIGIDYYPGDGTVNRLATQSTAAFPGKARFRMDVTPGRLTWTRLDTNQSVSTDHTAGGRGAYLHLFSGSQDVYWSNMTLP